MEWISQFWIIARKDIERATVRKSFGHREDFRNYLATRYQSGNDNFEIPEFMSRSSSCNFFQQYNFTEI